MGPDPTIGDPTEERTSKDHPDLDVLGLQIRHFRGFPAKFSRKSAPTFSPPKSEIFAVFPCKFDVGHFIAGHLITGHFGAAYFITMAEETPKTTLSGTKLPPFYRGEPALWFALATNALEELKITDDKAQFASLTLSLPQDVAALAQAIIIAPPASNRVQALQDKVVSICAKNKFDTVRDLVRHPGLSDTEVPTMLLAKFQADLPDADHKGLLFKVLFIEAMPDYVKETLAHMREGDVEKYAKAADPIVLNRRAEPSRTGQVSRINQAPPKAKTDDPPRLCYNHYRWGKETRKCQSPKSCPMAQSTKPSGNDKAGR